MSKYNKNKIIWNVIANYVHKTWQLNDILVLNESSNILITSSENLREIAPFDFQKHWREYQLV